jgi:hypothetical protein
MPGSIARRLEKNERDFLRGSIEEGRKSHFVNWDIVCSPVKSGGLTFPVKLYCENSYGVMLGKGIKGCGC